MGGGGKAPKETEEVFNVSMGTSRIFNTDRVYETLVAEANVKPNTEKYTPQVTLHGINKAGAYILLNYYNFSKWYGPYSLPTCSLLDLENPDDQIKSIIANKEGVTTEEIRNFVTTWEVVGNEVFNLYRLQELYDYRVNSKYLYYENTWLYNKEVISENKSIRTIFELVATVTNETTVETVIDIFYVDGVNDRKVVETYDVTKVVDKDRKSIITGTRVLRDTVESFIPSQTEKASSKVEITSTVDVVQTPITIPEPVVPYAPYNYCYYVLYQVDGRDKSWIYYPLLGTNASIGQVNIPGLGVPLTATRTVEMYPMTVLRHNHFSINEYNINVKNLPAGDDTYDVYRPDSITEKTYEDTEWVVNSLNMTLEDLLEPISENPDINYIADVVLCLAVEPDDYHPIVSKLLFETFIEFNVIQQPHIKSFAINRDPFNMGVSWQAVRTVVKEGTIGSLGVYSHSLENISTTTTYGWYYTYEYHSFWGSNVVTSETKHYGKWQTHTITKTDDEGNTYEESFVTYESIEVVWSRQLSQQEGTGYKKRIPEIDFVEYAGTALVLKHQTTEHAYEEIRIWGLKAATVIGRSVQGYIDSSATSEAFIMPIPVNVVNLMTPLERVSVLERGLRLVYYSAQMHVQHLQWYQTGIFKVLLQIVAIIIIAVVSYFTAGTTTAPLVAAMQSLFYSVLVGVAINLAINLLTSLVDVPFLKEILAVVATVVGMMYGYVDTSLFNLVMTAVDFVNAVISMTLGEINMDTLEVQQNRVAMAGQYNELSEEYTDIYQDLIEGGMATEKIVDLASQDTVKLISPNAYYGLTTGNILANYDLLYNSAYDSVSNFYKDSLTLENLNTNNF